MTFTVAKEGYNNIMKNIIKKVIWASLFFVPNLAFGAMENNYPEIPISLGRTLAITANSNPVDYIMYFYAFFLAIASIIAVVVLVWAGLEFIISSGDPKNIAPAKNKAIGSLIGLALILGSYIILNTISPTLTNPVVGSVSCDKSNVCVETHIGTTGKITYANSLGDSGNLELGSGDTMVITKYKGLKEIWGFTGLNYTETPQNIYSDSDMSNLTNDLPSSITIDSNIKSIKVYSKQVGVYLYDAPNFGVTRSAPLFLSGSNEDLGGFNVKSVQFVNDTVSRYYGVLFALSKYNNSYDYGFPQGTNPSCSEVLYDNVNNVSLVNTGSILIFKSKADFLATPVSGIVFYDILSCDTSTATDHSCPTTPGTLFESRNLACPAGFESPDVLSVMITKNAGVLLSSLSNKYCKFFDITSPNRVSGDCVSNDVFFDFFSKNRITSKFIIIPYENKF
jgi:hypothetical protein